MAPNNPPLSGYTDQVIQRGSLTVKFIEQIRWPLESMNMILQSICHSKTKEALSPPSCVPIRTEKSVRNHQEHLSVSNFNIELTMRPYVIGSRNRAFAKPEAWRTSLAR